MYFLHAINSDRQTRLLNVLGQIAMILGDKKNKIGVQGQPCRNPLLIFTCCVNVVRASIFIWFFPFCFVTTKHPRYC